MQNIDVTVEVKHELGDISRDLFIESADYTCRCRKLNQWDACPLCRHSCGWSVSKSSGIMWRRLTHIQGQLLAALTDILCYQIPAKIASCQDQQPTTPASTQATVPQRDCYLSGSASLSRRRFASIRGETYQGMGYVKRFIYLMRVTFCVLTQYLRLGYGVYPISDRRCRCEVDSSDPQLYPRLTLVGPRPRAASD